MIWEDIKLSGWVPGGEFVVIGYRVSFSSTSYTPLSENAPIFFGINTAMSTNTVLQSRTVLLLRTTLSAKVMLIWLLI